MKKRLLSMFLALMMCLSVLPSAAFAENTVGDVPINEVNFPDPVFREYVKNLPGGDDGIFTTAEIDQITRINCFGTSVENLTGIEYFTALKDVHIHRYM